MQLIHRHCLWSLFPNAIPEIALSHSSVLYYCAFWFLTEEVILNEERTTDEEKMKIIEGLTDMLLCSLTTRHCVRPNF